MKKLLLSILALAAISFGWSQTFQEMMNNPGAYPFEQIRATAADHFAQTGTGHGTGYKQYMRWEFFAETHLNSDGKLANATERAIQAQAEYIASDYYQNLPTSKTHNGYWTPIGPASWTFQSGNGPGNGRVNSVAFHPSNSSIMYAGTALGGVWRTTDTGLNWTPITDGMPMLSVASVAVNPSNANVIYALTGDQNQLSPSIGVIKTTNGGVSWKMTGDLINGTTGSQVFTQIDMPLYNTRGYKIIIHPTSTNTVFVATTAGIFRSTNGGSTWTNVRTGSFTDIAFRPGTPSTLYAVTTAGFWRSTDTGETWTNITSGLPTTDFTRAAIGVTAANTNYVYIVYGGGSTGFRGLYRSTNAGTSFTLRSSSPNIFANTQDGSGTGHQALWDCAITVSPSNAETVLVGGVNIWRSTNGGTSWTVKSDWVYNSSNTGPYCHADIQFLAYNGTTLWVASDGGVFRSTNNGDTYANRSNGMQIMQFYRICTGSSNYYGGAQDNGTFMLSGSSSQGTHIRGGDGFECLVNPTNNSIVYVSSQQSYARRVGTGAWSGINPPNVDAPWNVGWIMRPGTPTTLFLGTHQTNIWRSTDEGSNWTNIGGAFANGQRIRSLAIGASNTTRLYAATRTLIRRSDNATAATPTWTTITSNLPANRFISGIAVDPNNSNNVFISMSGYNAGQKVYQSTDAGANWTNISGTLPNIPAHCIVHDGSAGGLYIGTDIGVFYRNNTTGGWLPFMNGLPNTIVTELEIRSGESRIYAGTFGRGMWRSDLFTTCAPNLTLTPGNDPSSAVYTGYQYYTASNSVTSTRTIAGGDGTKVTYRAGNFVSLNEGFTALIDNEFIAEIGSCNSVFQPLPPLSEGILELTAVELEAALEEGQQGTLPVSMDANLRMPMRAYPNPFGVSFNLEVPAYYGDRKIAATMYDLSGKVVKNLQQQRVPTGMQLVMEIYTDDLAPGVYVLRVAEGEHIETFRLVKQ